MMEEQLKKANDLIVRIDDLKSMFANKDCKEDKAIRTAIENRINKLKKEFETI